MNKSQLEELIDYISKELLISREEIIEIAIENLVNDYKGNCVSPYLSPDENINIILTESQLKATSYAIAMAIKDYEDTYVNHTTGQYTCGGTTYIDLQARDLERVKEKLENANHIEDLQ